MSTTFSMIFQGRYLSLCVLVALALLAGCKGDDNGGGGDDDPDLTAQQQRAELMSGIWLSTEVLETPDDTEDAAMQELESLQMTFGVNQDDLKPTTFASTGAPTYFNAGSGATWKWTNDDPDVAEVMLSAVSPVDAFTITAFTNTTMTISFDFEGAATGRVEGIGTYRVQLTKQ
ncbi:MAG: hypothetical protein RIG62_04060 [Cyclobacteriaceae bacterium]